MKVNFSEKFLLLLNEQVNFIAIDKPSAARKFKKMLLQSLKKDLNQPFNFKKSIYYDDENIRDYVFKGYTSVYKIDLENKTITVFGFIKFKQYL